MDFQSLSRKELQALCKKNKIPANMTNVAMGDALAALQKVEGLAELLNPVDADAQRFPDEKGVGTPDIHRTACRTSTRRKTVGEEPESSKVSTRLQRRTRVGIDEGIDQQNKDLNAPVTPAVPSGRRRATAISTRRKKETEMLEDEKNGGQERPTDVPKTPSAPTSRVRATSAYSTRRSVRLLEKNLSKMNLMDDEDTGSMKIDEIEMANISQHTEDSAATEKGASLQKVSTEFSEKTYEIEVTSLEKNIGYECQSNESNSDVQLGSKVANESQVCLGKIKKLEIPFKDMNNDNEGGSHDSNSKPEASFEKCNSDEVSECCDESDVDLTKSIGKEVDANNEAGTAFLFETENFCDSSEPESKKSPGATNDAFPVEDDCSVEVPEDKHEENEHSNVGNDIQNSELFGAENKAAEMDLASPKGAIERGSSNLCSFGEKHGSVKDNMYTLRVDSEKLEAKVKTSDSEESKEYVEKDASSENYVADIQVCIEPSLDIDVNEAKAEPETIDFQTDIEECKEYAAVEETLDATSPQIPAADQQVSVVSGEFIDGNFTVSYIEPSLDIDVNEAKAEPETIDFQTDIEERKEYAAAEETLHATSPEIPAADQQVSVVSGEFNDGNSTVSYSSEASMSGINCNANTLVGSDVVPEEVAIINHDKSTDETLNHTSPSNHRVSSGDVDDLTLSIMTAAPIFEQFPCPARSELKDNTIEHQTVRKINQEDDEQKIDEMKENLNADELQKKSVRELKKMLRNLTLDGKTNSKSNNSAKEVERKRTALQVLPENRMTAGQGQNDGCIG